MDLISFFEIQPEPDLYPQIHLEPELDYSEKINALTCIQVKFFSAG